MKKSALFASVAMLVFLGNSYADEKVVGYIPSPEGDYQKLSVSEDLKVPYSNPQQGKVLIAADREGHAQWGDPKPRFSYMNSDLIDLAPGPTGRAPIIRNLGVHNFCFLNHVQPYTKNGGTFSDADNVTCDVSYNASNGQWQLTASTNAGNADTGIACRAMCVDMQ